MLLFLLQAPTHHSVTFNMWSLYKLKRNFRLTKTVCEIFHFRFSTKCMDSLTLKHYNSFQNENNIKVTHRFALRPLIFKLQQAVSKFNYICVSWSYQNWPGVRLLKLRKLKFWERPNVTCKQIFDISLLNILFISLLNPLFSSIELKNIH